MCQISSCGEHMVDFIGTKELTKELEDLNGILRKLGMKDLTDQVTSLNGGLTKLESQITFLNSVMSSMERQMSGLNENVTGLNEHAGSLTGTVGGLDTTLKTLGEVLASLSLIIFQINKVLELAQVPLRLLTNCGTVIGGGIDLLFNSAKTVLTTTEDIAAKVETLALPFSVDETEEEE